MPSEGFMVGVTTGVATCLTMIARQGTARAVLCDAFAACRITKHRHHCSTETTAGFSQVHTCSAGPAVAFTSMTVITGNFDAGSLAGVVPGLGAEASEGTPCSSRGALTLGASSCATCMYTTPGRQHATQHTTRRLSRTYCTAVHVSCYNHSKAQELCLCVGPATQPTLRAY